MGMELHQSPPLATTGKNATCANSIQYNQPSVFTGAGPQPSANGRYLGKNIYIEHVQTFLSLFPKYYSITSICVALVLGIVRHTDVI
jgi:hypothetical protein